MGKRGLSVLLTLVLLVAPVMQAMIPGNSAFGGVAISALAEDTQEPSAPTTATPIAQPTTTPAAEPTAPPVKGPTDLPSESPVAPSSEAPSEDPAPEPSLEPTSDAPSESASEEPTPAPAQDPAISPEEADPSPLPTEALPSEEPQGPAIDTTRNATYSLDFTSGWVDIASGASLLKSPGGESFATLSGGVGYALARPNAGEPGDCLLVAFSAIDGDAPSVQTAYIAARSLRPMAEGEIAAYLAQCEGASSAVRYQGNPAQPLLALTVTPVQAAEAPDPTILASAPLIAPMSLTGTYNAGDIAVINDLIDNNGLSWKAWDPSESDTPPESWENNVRWTDDDPDDLRIDSLNLESWGLKGTLDVTALTELKYLYCASNDLSAVNASGLSNLFCLRCEANRNLKTLNVSGCTSLEDFRCSHTDISILDMSDCGVPISFNCNGIPLQKLKLRDRELNVSVDPAIGGKARIFGFDCEVKEIYLFIQAKPGYVFDSWSFSGLATNPIVDQNMPQFIIPEGSATVTAHMVADASADAHDPGDIAVINSLMSSNGLDWGEWDTGVSDQPPESWEPYIDWASDGQTLRVSTLYLVNSGLAGALDLTGLTGLQSLRCIGNDITSLDVSDLPMLTDVSCQRNVSLTVLNAVGCPELYSVNVPKNNLDTLNLTGSDKLSSLNCESNNLSALDLSGYPLLTNLNCASNGITTLDVSACAYMRNLNCNNNNLTALDVSAKADLGALSCSDNHITALDVSGCDELENLICRNNQLISLNVTGCDRLMILDCDNNNLTSLDFSQNAALETVSCEKNPISHLNAGGGRKLNLVIYPAGGSSIDLEYEPSNHSVILRPKWNQGYKLDNWSFAGFPDDSEPTWDTDELFCILPPTSAVITANLQVPYPAPQNLAWGPNATAKWDSVPETDGHYTVALYYDDGSSESLVVSRNHEGTSGLFYFAQYLTVSGRYRFSVRAGYETDGKVSVEAFSPVYEHILPAAILGTPTNLRWENGPHGIEAVWNWPANTELTDAFEFCLYRNGTRIGSGQWYETERPGRQNWSYAMEEDGNYTFTVRMISGNLDEKRDGVVSGHSPVAVRQPTLIPAIDQWVVPVGDTATLPARVWPQSAVAKAITYKSSNTAIATVSSAGVIKGVKTGTATITATAKIAGGSTLTAKCTIYVGKRVSKVSLPSTISISPTKGAKLKATITPSDAALKTLAWFSEGPRVVKVSESGVLTGISLGTGVIFAETTDGSGKHTTCTVTVGPSVTGVTLNKTTAPIHTGKTLALKATITPSNAGVKAVTWSSSNTAIATVDSKGVVKGVKAGTATITVKTADRAKTATCKVTIGPSVTGVKLSKTTAPINTGKTLALKATIAPSNAANKAVTWSSSNTAVATVSSTGMVTGVKAGTATITVKTAEGARTATCKVTIGPPVTGVTLSKTTAPIHTGKTLTLKATITPSNAANKAVTWTTSNKAIATVSSSGVVKGVKAGTATITVKTAEGAKIATCKVTIGPAVKSIKLSKTTANLYIGKTLTLKATFTPSNAANKGLSWTSSNTAVATVSSAGVVTGVKAGTVTITAKTVDGAKKAICKVKVGAQVTGVTLSKTAAPIITGTTLTLKAAVAPSNALNKAVTWTSSNKAVATVTSAGVVKGVKAGTATITVKTAEGAKIATCTVTVGPAVTGVTLNKQTETAEAGTSLTLLAAITPSNAANMGLTWTTSDPEVASVNNEGVVTCLEPGIAVITVKTADGAKTATCTVTVSLP